MHALFTFCGKQLFVVPLLFNGMYAINYNLVSFHIHKQLHSPFCQQNSIRVTTSGNIGYLFPYHGSTETQVLNMDPTFNTINDLRITIFLLDITIFTSIHLCQHSRMFKQRSTHACQRMVQFNPVWTYILEILQSVLTWQPSFSRLHNCTYKKHKILGSHQFLHPQHITPVDSSRSSSRALTCMAIDTPEAIFRLASTLRETPQAPIPLLLKMLLPSLGVDARPKSR